MAEQELKVRSDTKTVTYITVGREAVSGMTVPLKDQTYVDRLLGPLPGQHEIWNEDQQCFVDVPVSKLES